MDFCHLKENLEINTVGKLIDTATIGGIDAPKTASKRLVQRTAEPAGDLIENIIANKITSLGKTKSKEKEDERQAIQIPHEKRQQIFDLSTK